MRYPLLSAVFLLGVMAGSVPVQAGDVSVQAYVQASFLPPQLLTPPPAEGSKAWHTQIVEVLEAQKNITPQDLTALRDEQNVRLDQMTSVLGASFTRDRLPKTFAMLDRVMSGTGQVIDADKKFWHTRRPYLTDTRVKLYVDPIDSNPAYPSGHTAGSRVLAEVLGLLVPEKLAALRARANAIAYHRIEAGVHYPVDVEGGRMLAMLIVGALSDNEDFQDDLAAARKELAAAK